MHTGNEATGRERTGDIGHDFIVFPGHALALFFFFFYNALISTQINLSSYTVSLRTACKYEITFDPVKKMLSNKGCQHTDRILL